MNHNEIKEKLLTEEYDFLRNDEHLGNNIILLTVGGSHAYGTNIEGSDLDIRGISTERPSEILGLSNFDQFEEITTDTVIYGLRKFTKLALNCNPNVIEMLGTRDEDIFSNDKNGDLLRNNIDLFLSRKAIYSFGGYATAQLRRLQNALARDNYPQDQKEQHILNTINSQMLTIEDRYKDIDNGKLDLYIEESQKEDYKSEIFMDINLKHYPLRDFKNIYSEMHNVVRDYSKLNHRNNKKDEKHLLKHSMHLIRLLQMGVEVLQGEGVNTNRGDTLPLLMDIRNGKYTYDEIFELVDKYEKEFKYASENTNLQAKPDYKKVEELIIEINKEVIINDKS